MAIFLIISVLLLSYSNGANDNFKGVATLYGSGTMQYKPALALATITTLAGSICSYFFAEALLKNFSGKGLVPDTIVQSADFVLAVALASAATVYLATRLGFPISTTHSLVGALAGAGIIAVSTGVNFTNLGKTFFLPLLVSPFTAIFVSAALYFIFKRAWQKAGITTETCLCAGNKQLVPATASQSSVFVNIPNPVVTVDTVTNCSTQYKGAFLGINFQSLLNALHYTSAGIVSFARGLNDTPKLVSLLLVTQTFSASVNFIVVALAIAIGGLLNAKKIAETMSKKITTMNHGQGFTANLVTGFLVIAASRFGLPVSTTHVSVGSIFGTGLVNKTGDKKEISKIALSWLLTLPVAAVLSGLFYYIIHSINK